MSDVQALTYAEDFAIDLSSSDALLCDGVTTHNNVLRALNGYELFGARNDYKGIVGAGSRRLFVHNNKMMYVYDGERFTNSLAKIPYPNPESVDARYDFYRDAPYLAFDDDGVITFDENSSPNSQRWAFNDGAQDVAMVNERLVMLTQDGFVLRFSDCGKKLYSDSEARGDIVATITLPTAAQAIHRFDNNTLYVLGDVCYKATFSADEQDVKLNAVAQGLGTVVRRSVAQVGDSIVFATRNRLYALRNGKVTPVFEPLRGAVSSFDECSARAWRGLYVLTVPYDGGRRAYALDVLNGKCSAVLWKDVTDLCVFKDDDVMVKSDGTLVRSTDSAYNNARFVRSNVDFGVTRCKFLRRLNVTTKYDVYVVISDDGGLKRTYTVKGSPNPQTVNINGKGKSFAIEINSKGRMEVTAFSLVAEAYKEVYYGN